MIPQRLKKKGIPNQQRSLVAHSVPRRAVLRTRVTGRPGAIERTLTVLIDLFIAFRDQLRINLARVVIGRFCVGKLCLGDLRSLLRPALVDAGKTPTGTLARRTNGFPVHQYEDGVSVRRAKNPDREPTAPLDRLVKRHFVNASVRCNVLASHRLSVHHQLYWHLARVPNARPLDVPVRRLIYRAVMDAFA